MLPLIHNYQQMKQPVIFQIGWNACIKCGACVAICPQEAGFISEFDTIAVNRPCDIACMACEAICPVTTITHEVVEAGVNGRGMPYFKFNGKAKTNKLYDIE